MAQQAELLLSAISRDLISDMERDGIIRGALASYYPLFRGT